MLKFISRTKSVIFTFFSLAALILMGIKQLVKGINYPVTNLNRTIDCENFVTEPSKISCHAYDQIPNISNAE